MKYWNIVSADVARRCFQHDWVYLVKKLRDVLKQHDVPVSLQAAAHFMRRAKPLKVRTTIAVVAVCDFLHSYGIRCHIHEVTQFSPESFRDKYQPAEQSAVPA